MRKNISAGLFSVLVVVSFGIVVMKTAHAQTTSVSCSDGASSCGFITQFNPSQIPGITSQCSLYGKGDQGGEYCDQNGNVGYLDGQTGSWVATNNVVGHIPTSAQLNYGEDPDYNYGIFNGTSIELTMSATNGGTASAGNTTVSDMGCSNYCGYNDVNPPGNPSHDSPGFKACNSAVAYANGTADPGDPITIQMEAICKPNNGSGSSCVVGGSGSNACGEWATGNAYLFDLNAVTACDSSANPNSPYIDPNNTSLGRRNYVPTAQGACAPNNLPATSTPAQIALSEVSSPLITDNVTTSTTHSMNVLNVGGTAMNWQGSFDSALFPWVSDPDLEGQGLSLKSKPAWVNISEADSAIPVGGSAPETFTFDHGDVSAVGSATSGLVQFDCEGSCSGSPSVNYTLNYLVPAPTIGSFTQAGSVVSGESPVLEWSGVNNYNTGANAAKAICITSSPSGLDRAFSQCTSGSSSGSMTASAISGPTTYLLTVHGLSDVAGATGNTVDQSITVTPSAVPLPTCTPNTASQNLPSGGGTVSFMFTGSGGANSDYLWTTNLSSGFPTETSNSYTTTYGWPGQETVYIESQGTTAVGQCTVNVNAAPTVASASLTLTDTTAGQTIGSTPTGAFKVGDGWQFSLTTANIPAGTSFDLCGVQPGGAPSCSPSASYVLNSSGSWSLPGTFTATSSWTEWVQFGSPNVTSNNVNYTVSPGAAGTFACTLTASPSSGTGSVSPMLTWTSTGGATSCTASGGSSGWAAARGTSGSWLSPAITQTTQFSMICSNAIGSNVSCNGGTPATVTVGSATSHYSCSGTSCVLNSSGPYTASNCNNSCGVSPPTALSCSPTTQGASVSQDITVSASGGTGTYSWLLPGGISPSPVSGQTVGDIYSTPATYWATVMSGANSAQCSIVVGSGSATSSITSLGVTCPATSTLGSVFFCSANLQGSGNFTDYVNWSASNASITAETALGAHFAPIATGTAVITATSRQDSSFTGVGYVTVSSSASVPTSTISSVTLSCPSSVQESGSVTCTVSVQGTGSFNPAVNWSTSNGFITTGGVFTAPAASGTAVVTATSVQDPSKDGMYAITVTSGPTGGHTVSGVIVSCPATLQPGQMGLCTATIQLGDLDKHVPWLASQSLISKAEAANPGVVWSTTEGTIDQNGNYTAPLTPGTAIVTAVSTVNPAISGSFPIAIVLAPTNMASLSANPSSADTVTPVDLVATIGGTATGTVNYSFWWDCSGNYASVASATAACGDPTNAANGAKFNGEAMDSQSVSHTYSAPGTYSPMVILERGSASPAEAQVPVTVANAQPSLSLTASPSSVTFGEPSSLTWSSANVTSCTAASSPSEGDWTGAKPTNSAGLGQTVVPSLVGATSETYSLTCKGTTGSNVTQSAVVTVKAPPQVSCSSFTAKPTNLVPPQQSTLSWTCSNASACSMNGTSTGSPLNGTMIVTPATTTQYLLDCTGLGGWGTATSSLTVTVGGSTVHEVSP